MGFTHEVDQLFKSYTTMTSKIRVFNSGIYQSIDCFSILLLVSHTYTSAKRRIWYKTLCPPDLFYSYFNKKSIDCIEIGCSDL